MEWVETTGKTVDEAKEHALDQLGVDEHDAEFEIVELPKQGLFGRTRGEARVRARVRPVRPRPKVDRRDRRRRGRDSGEGESRETKPSQPAANGEHADAPGDTVGDKSQTAKGVQVDNGTRERPRRRRGGRGQGNRPEGGEHAAESGGEGSEMTTDVTVEEQGEIIRSFLEGLVDAFGLEGDVTSAKVDDETVEVQVLGADLGLMIGPKGQTLQCIQELARTVVQRQATGTHHGRVRIDVGQYRLRRREALERFTRQVAADVKASGVQKALEPMGPADRKVVHDTANDIDGVSTVSEGEEPRRRVVILPADD